MNRVATLGLPVAYGLSGLLLLALSLVTGSAGALAAAVLLATLLLAQVADPPVGGAAPRRRAIGRIAAAATALVLATVAMIATIAAGLDLVARWQWIAVGGGVAALILLLPVVALRRVTLEVPILRSERTALTRGAAIGATLGATMLIAGYVVPAAAALIAVAFALISVLEGVAMARPGGAGLRRLPTDVEVAAVDAAVATGPPEVIGHRRVVVRSTGGAEYLSLEVLMRQRVAAGRAQEICSALEQSIKGALPDLVVSVRIRVGELPPAGPEDPTRQLDDTRTQVFDEEATAFVDDQPTELLEDQPTETDVDPVLPSAPWQQQ
ncbi:MAG: hypothetical protein ACR2J9_09040 [Gaiellales bacterium]